ncbi:vomeronasal type-2 receptor 26 [Xenopus tropicalis]|uniref:Vomeronasal type-2 receptor 26 n=1 Tax=Xenopus tropicalis TaxID=8364 RepID=A0A8J0SD80_XENTR|nr:vomeronasal type-2 receptor 26 [Xenopus tropicalis]|eukprot:XP_012811564.1 PREDICTED: vomeronasal type-2 receptor 26-like [Xenopus tropicalis]
MLCKDHKRAVHVRKPTNIQRNLSNIQDLKLFCMEEWAKLRCTGVVNSYLQQSGIQPLSPACHLEIIKVVEEYDYIQEGDIMIGGVMTAHLYMINVTFPRVNSKRFLCTAPSQQQFRHFIDFRFAVEQTNKDPARLPNLTLGYHISDSCEDPLKAVRSVLQILSGTREPVPNYSCVGKRNIAGFIGDEASETTVPIAQILSIYGLSQISYGATAQSLRDRVAFPYFFRTVQSEETSYLALGKLLSHFGWTWVGIITSDDISGEREHQLLAKYLSREGVCVEFTIRIKTNNDIIDTDTLQKSFTSVILLCGTVSLFLLMRLILIKSVFLEKTWILSTNWGTNDLVIRHGQELFDCSLGLVPGYHYDLDTPEMRNFLDNLHPSNYPEDKLLENIWMIFHLCLLEDPNKNHLYEYIYLQPLHNCTGQERITDLSYFTADFSSPQVHLAVDLMSQALHDMNIHPSEKHVGKKEMYHYVHQLHRYLKALQYNSPDGPNFYFGENGEYITSYRIYNYVITAGYRLTRNLIGDFSPWDPPDQQLHIAWTALSWRSNTVRIPRAQCTDSCPLGFRKAPMPGVQTCCYDCVPCSEGEISNITDSISCFPCPDMEWPNERKDQCIASKDDFLSYTNDTVSVLCSSISILFFLITSWISGVFITYRDSPIVRANNRSLSFLLLVSIKLSFLSVFLFLGRPVDITCMLRIITFGITFSIAVSSLLAKTIMVCVAFKATKPGSSWRKWLGVKLSNSVVLFCSSIQIIICMTWLAISPPFQELDIHTSPGTIIIQCNEGSDIGFYSVIGYMGLLAAVSFVLAFLARSLPDSFNEAKYITFSMLLFCSVWITMIPAYLSTKGKNTVCVEIFAILTSSAGLLACIFLPKCYTILLRPEINLKTNLLGNK